MGVLSDEEFRSLLDLARCGDSVARERLVAANRGLVVAIAGRFRRLAGEEYEDTLQVAYLGLLKAIDNFDPSRGTKFSTYAFPVIAGEIRRYLRDSGLLHVNRSIQESSRRVASARAMLESRLGREPTVAELASETGLDRDEVVEALDASCPLVHLDESGYGSGLSKITDAIERVVDEVSLRQALGRLEPRERMVISLRYSAGLTQTSVACRLGISQAQVSREEKSALERLRRLMLAGGEA